MPSTPPVAGTGSRADEDDTFVFVARGMVADDAVLDLVDLAPSTIRIRWSGGHDVSYLSTGQFLDHWLSRRTAATRARFGLLRAHKLTGNPVGLLVRDPRIVGSGIRWTLAHADCRVLRESGSCVLVLNPPEWPDARVHTA